MALLPLLFLSCSQQKPAPVSVSVQSVVSSDSPESGLLIAADSFSAIPDQSTSLQELDAFLKSPGGSRFDLALVTKVRNILVTQTALENFPTQFTIEETLGSAYNPLQPTTLKLKSGALGLGSISRKVLDVRTVFEFTDADGNLVARGVKELLSWGTKIEIEDNQGQVIGKLHEEVFESMFKIVTQYRVLDARDQIVAQSEKIDFGGTEFTLTSPDGKTPYLDITRPMFNPLGDTWTVTQHPQNRIDPRIVAILPVYKTHADAQDNGATESSKSDKKESSPR